MGYVYTYIYIYTSLSGLDKYRSENIIEPWSSTPCSFIACESNSTMLSFLFSLRKLYARSSQATHRLFNTALRQYARHSQIKHRLFNMAPRPPLNGRQNDQIHVILGIEKFKLPLARPTEVAPVEIDVVAGWQIKTAQHPDQNRFEESGRRSSNHVMNDEHV